MNRRGMFVLAACSAAGIGAGVVGIPAAAPLERALAAYPETAPSAGQFCRSEHRGVTTTAQNGDTVRCTPQGSRHRWITVSAAQPTTEPPEPESGDDGERERSRDRERAAARERARLGRQLSINQRISQATILRANAIEEKLNAGLETADIRTGALTRATFGPGITITGSDDAVDPPPNPRRPLTVEPLPVQSGGSLTPSATQLRTNQRIAQAAVRRANGLRQRMNGGLTGGDIGLQTIVPAQLAPGLQITAFEDLPRPAASQTVIAAPGAAGGSEVTLSQAQLLINQRISQAAIRRLNELRDQIETGLTAEAFADGTITGTNLAR